MAQTTAAIRAEQLQSERVTPIQAKQLQFESNSCHSPGKTHASPKQRAALAQNPTKEETQTTTTNRRGETTRAQQQNSTPPAVPPDVCPCTSACARAHWCVCVSVCVCACACARAWMCACVDVCVCAREGTTSGKRRCPSSSSSSSSSSSFRRCARRGSVRAVPQLLLPGQQSAACRDLAPPPQALVQSPPREVSGSQKSAQARSILSHPAPWAWNWLPPPPRSA
mmetsp:Transcript_45688/g.93463  ORF Transcript_45688/g.93463 Transcript_45688/m.93463 type:complete len:225 (-) Transcript_45688:454-1128(-)